MADKHNYCKYFHSLILNIGFHHRLGSVSAYSLGDFQAHTTTWDLNSSGLWIATLCTTRSERIVLRPIIWFIPGKPLVSRHMCTVNSQLVIHLQNDLCHWLSPHSFRPIKISRKFMARVVSAPFLYEQFPDSDISFALNCRTQIFPFCLPWTWNLLAPMILNSQLPRFCSTMLTLWRHSPLADTTSFRTIHTLPGLMITVLHRLTYDTTLSPVFFVPLLCFCGPSARFYSLY